MTDPGPGVPQAPAAAEDQPALAPAYRWCLKAYPRSYLVAHGDDLSSLVAEVHAGETRPSVRECASIVRAGLTRRARTGRARYWFPVVLFLEAAGALAFVASMIGLVAGQRPYPGNGLSAYVAEWHVQIAQLLTYLLSLSALAGVLTWRGIRLTGDARHAHAGELRRMDVAVIVLQPFLFLALAVEAFAGGGLAVYPSYAAGARLVLPTLAGVLVVVVAKSWRPLRLSLVATAASVLLVALLALPIWIGGISFGGDASAWWAPSTYGPTGVRTGFTQEIAVPDGSSLPVSVACPTPTNCFAFGSVLLPATLGDHDDVLAVTTDGRSWRAERFPTLSFTRSPASTFELGSLACPTSSQCYFSGSGLAIQPYFLARSADGGRTWMATAPLAHILGIPQLLCPDVNTCLVFSSSGLAVTHDGGAVWATPVRFPPSTATRDAVQTRGISCPEVMHCAALFVETSITGTSHVQQEYVLATTTDGGTSWTLRRVDAAGFFAGGGLTCAPHLCLVPAASGPSSGGVWVSTNDGRTWADHVQASAVEAITCPTPQVCWALNYNSTRVLRSLTGGISWQAVAPFGRSLQVRSMSCATPNSCTVVATSTSHTRLEPFIASTSDAGRSWDVIPFPKLALKYLPPPRPII